MSIFGWSWDLKYFLSIHVYLRDSTSFNFSFGYPVFFIALSWFLLVQSKNFGEFWLLKWKFFG